MSSISCVATTVLSSRVGWGVGIDTKGIPNAVCVLGWEDNTNNTHRTI